MTDKRKTLSDLMIGKLPKPKATRMIWDKIETGLIIKLTPAGRKIFCLQQIYPDAKAQAIRTLGLFPALKIESTPERPGARQIARKWKAWIADDTDPRDGEAIEQQQKEEARRAEALEKAKHQANSFRKVAQDYIADKRTWKKRNRRIDDDAREIERDLIAEWGTMPITAIMPRHVRELLGKLRKGGFKDSKGRIRKDSDYNALAAWGHAEQIFKFAVGAEVIEASPCASIDKKQLFKGADLGSRQRVLDETEIAAFWRAAGRLDYPMGPFYQLLLLTALRRSELGEGKWTEFHPELRGVLRKAAAKKERIDWTRVDPKYKLLTIPSERFKSDAVHIVPLSDMACSILETLPRWKDSDWLFTNYGATAINDFSKGKAKLDARMLRSLQAMARRRGEDPAGVKLEGWVQHDTRRTIRSKLGSLKLKGDQKVADHVSELILGHARKGLDGTYDRNAYIDERREALEAWAEYVRSVTEPKPASPPRATAGNVSHLRVVQ